MKYAILGFIFVMLVGCTAQGSIPNKTLKNSVIPEKVQVCVACHGVDGRHGKENVPKLGGRTYDDLISAMQRVKEAYSPQPLLGHRLSDLDMHDIAIYFSTVKKQ